MTENTVTPALERAAKVLWARSPEDYDWPEFIPDAVASLDTALDVEDLAAAVPKALYAWTNGTKQVWVQLGPNERLAIAEAIRTAILGDDQ
jgi:hypothetical protein